MEEFLNAGYTEDQAKELTKICNASGIEHYVVICAMNNFREVAESFTQMCYKWKNSISKYVENFNINNDFKHNWHMATHAKKKRTRKKYAKKCLK